MSDLYLCNTIESFGNPPMISGGVRLQPMQIHERNEMGCSPLSVFPYPSVYRCSEPGKLGYPPGF